ncbi:hypothetical protein F2Q69_00008856 [Brassica cretica]|uniref:NB-ARC domain-containing protein n=1 Tax=Brassica cretica TaxID=69181 RepID=A0A8S9P7Y9_BRACR|nr:hypothetical protein F2Q69_00008856 [Brassica cretica]
MESHMTRMGSLLQLDSDEVRKVGILGPSGIGKTTIARSLFNRHSQDFQLSIFMDNIKNPKNGFRDLALEVMSLVGELPLGLRVMGSYFWGMSKQGWTEALSRLRTHLDRDGEIASILKFSYDALNDEDKRLFLHLACFFRGEPVDMVERCLEKCFEDVRQGLGILSEKSLIYSESGLIMMSTLLFQLGRQIVRKESINEPGKRQFLNDANDISEVLSDHKAGNSSVIGITLEPNEEITWTSERAFERFSNLQFLRILGRGVNPRKFLVQLDMTSSRLKKLWKENKLMDLNTSRSLKELPDLSTATNLQKLNLRACSSLVKLPSSIGNAFNLQILNLSDCSRLVKLPSTIGNAFHLKKVNLSRCSRLVELPSSIWNIVNLKKLDLNGCSSLVEHPSSIWNIVNFKKLDLNGCSSLVELPSIENAINLRKLKLSYCSSLVKLPSSIGNATNLQELDLSYCSSLRKLPSSMRNLGRLWKLELKECSKLEVNLANINLESLGELDLSDCSLLKSYSTNIQEPDPCTGRISRLSQLVPRGIKKLVSLPLLSDSLGEHLSDGSLLKSYPESSTNIKELDSWIERVSCLHRLVLSGMKKLLSIPQLPDSVLELDAENCESLETLDCSFRRRVIRLNFRNCFKLNQQARDLISLTQTSEYAAFPAEKVPMCFTYRSSGSSLTLKLNQTPLGKSTKFKVCFICADVDEDGFGCSDDAFVCCSITTRGNTLISSYKEMGRVFQGHLYTFEVEVETEEVISTELVFEFEVNWAEYNSKICEIKECGILPLLDVPLLSFRDVYEDFEPSDIELVRVNDGGEDYEPSDNESSGDSAEDYELSDNIRARHYQSDIVILVKKSVMIKPVLGINLEWDEEKTWTTERAFERFSNLQFLRIKSNCVNLRKFLVKQEMQHSSKPVKFWEGIKPLSSLKCMDLSRSESLKELPDLSTATNLQELDFSYCSSLVKLPFSIGSAGSLQKLNLKYCSRLVDLPFSMKNFRLSKLESQNCSKLEVVLANINLSSLEYLDLSRCSLLKSSHESSAYIVLSGMNNLVSIPALRDSLLVIL